MQAVRSSGAAILPLTAVAGLMASAPLGAFGEPIEEIVVTGSHLKRADATGPAPVEIYSSDDVALATTQTLGDFARYLPINAGGRTEAAARGGDSRGTAQFDLRGLGIDATLVLVNGVRTVPYGAAQDGDIAFVDINSIPLAAVERVEILKDGASALYGADAVAGVVNIVLKSRIDKPSLTASYLATADGDQSEYLLSAAAGRRFGATTINGFLSFQDRKPLFSSQRAYSADSDRRPFGGFNDRSFFSSPPTVFIPSVGFPRADPACPPATEVANLDVFVPGLLSTCSYNTARFGTSVSAAERLSALLSAEHRRGPVTLFAEYWAVANDGESRRAAAPLNTNLAQTITGFPRVPVSHPFNTFGEDVEIAYRAVEAGSRIDATDALTQRLVVGATGRARVWDWRARSRWAASDVTSLGRNAVLIDAFQAALLGNGGSAADAYFNPFGATPDNRRDVIDRFVTTTRTAADRRERGLELTLTRTLDALPGAGAALAIGVDYRREDIDETLDPELLAQNIAGAPAANAIDASRRVISAYAELSWHPWHPLEVQLASRFEDYDDFGDNLHPKLAVRWQAHPMLALRGSFSTSFRPPSFRELFNRSAPSTQFFVDTQRCPLTGSLLDCTIFPYNAITRGNEDLSAEEGKSYYAGAFLGSPQGRLSASLDWWRLDHEERIVFVGGQTVIDEFAPNSPFVERAAPAPAEAALGIPGRIITVTSSYLNADSVIAEGIDVGLSWQPAGGAFEPRLRLSYSYLARWEIEEAFADEFSENRAGRDGLPRHRALLSAGFGRGAHSIDAQLRYVGSYESPLGLVVPNEVETDVPVRVKDWATVDVRYSLELPELSASLAFGCQNCLDREPPDYNYTFTGESIHDGRGAIWFVSLRYGLR
ncbi:MAG: TonB-dependent receptor [Pseudomonadota bacterium]